MKPDDLSVSDLLAILDSCLSAALREIRRARRGPGPEPAPPAPDPRVKSRSRIRLAREVLLNAGRPMHIRDIVSALADQGVPTTRDSLVSAVSKLLAPHGPFVRPAPNTFGLKEWEQ